MEAIEAKQIHIRFTRALSSYDNHADAHHRISRKLASLLPHQANVRYRRMLEIGCGTGGFTGVLKQQCHIDEWILNDLCEDCQEKIEQLFPGSPPRFIAGDAETLSFPGKFDLIASASVFQWMKEPETFLHKLSGLLMQQGLLLFSTFVPGRSRASSRGKPPAGTMWTGRSISVRLRPSCAATAWTTRSAARSATTCSIPTRW